jgi:hypothetical protein
MWRKIQEAHPALAEAEQFIDWQKYRLGRLQSEMRTEFKKVGVGKPRVDETVRTCENSEYQGTVQPILFGDPED